MPPRLKLGPDDDQDVPQKGDADQGPGTLQESMPPLTAQPAAAAPGPNLSLLASPDLSIGPKPGGLEGQQPTPRAPRQLDLLRPATYTPGYREAKAEEAPTGEAAPTPRGSTLKDILDQLPDHQQRVSNRTKEIYDSFNPGMFWSPEEKVAAFRAAGEQAERELSPKLLGALSAATLGAEKNRISEERAQAYSSGKESQRALNAANIQKIQQQLQFAPINLESKVAGVNSRIALNNANMVEKAAQTGSIEAGTAKTVADTWKELAPEFEKGNVQGVNHILNMAPKWLADLIGPSIGVGPSPATAQLRAGFQGAIGNMDNQPPVPQQPPVPPVDMGALRQAMSRGTGAQPPANLARMPLRSVADGAPAAGGGALSAGEVGVSPNAMQAGQLAGGGGPGTAPRGPSPQPVTQGLNKPVDETAILQRLKDAGMSDNDGKLRRAIHLAVQELSNPNANRNTDRYQKAEYLIHRLGVEASGR